VVVSGVRCREDLMVTSAEPWVEFADMERRPPKGEGRENNCGSRKTLENRRVHS
jgi:hypothetical protein